MIGRRTLEIEALQRTARNHPDAVSEGVRERYAQADENSISTLQVTQPVRLAGQSLMPPPNVHYNTIAGSLSGQDPPGDGVVPLSSATLPGADSESVINYGHRLYGSEEAIAEVLRILRKDVADWHALRPEQ